jgi:2',3'-cyclic-nucleotide 2'-phosphodiesterase/3'-nucleotidase
MYRARLTDLRVASSRARLRLLETTDLHMHLFAHDYFTGRPAPGLGLARAARLIAGLRAEVANALLFDDGDFLQGSPLADHIGRRQGALAAGGHPLIDAMNRMGYAAATLGNHDFNYGLPFLEAALSKAEFPVISANTRRVDPGGGAFLPPYALLDRDLVTEDGCKLPLRLGVIGLLPPQTAAWERDRIDGRMVFVDMVAAARAMVPRMRAEGAQIVVALAHTGIGVAAHVPGMENAAVPLAAVEGIDVLMLGHAHQVFPSESFRDREGCDPDRGTVGGKPAVMAGSLGSHVGVIDLTLDHDGEGWRIAGWESRAVPVTERRRRPPGAAREMAAILDAARADHRATQRLLARAIGRTEMPLSTHFALVGDAAPARLVAAAKVAALRSLVAGMAVAALPLLAIAVPFRAGGRGGPEHYTHLPVGPLLERHLADLYPFGNLLRAQVMSCAEIVETLERGASVFNSVAAGVADQRLLNPDFPAHAFEMVAGLTYRIDVSRPPRFAPTGRRIADAPGRIRDLMHEGRPIDPAARFLVATNSHRSARDAQGRGMEVALPEDRAVRDALRRHLRGRVVTDIAPPGWRLSLPPGASVLFDTAPLADPALCPLPADPLGLTAEGFLRLRLREAAAA